MSKTMKIVSIMLVVVMLFMVISPVFAATPEDILKSDQISSKEVTPNDDIMAAASKVMNLIRTIAVVGGVILIMFLGVKFMMGSAEEKAEYKKSFMPLIIGIIVVMSASQIAVMLFDIMG